MPQKKIGDAGVAARSDDEVGISRFRGVHRGSEIRLGDRALPRRHQPIAMFGEDKAFDLNMHDFEAETKSAYVTVRYSNVKKAAADVPSVVGSMFATGALYMLVAVGGAGLGVGGTILVQKSGKSKAEDAPEAEATA